MYQSISAQLENLANPERAEIMQNFFKAGKGQYGEGDLFLGLTVPQVRIIAKQYYTETSLDDIANLLESPWHEVRLCAVVMLNYKFPKESVANQEKIYNLYKLKIGSGINNWDIIDVSCPHIIGRWLYDKPRDDLYIMATGGLWHKRTSIISTFYFLRKGEITETLMLAEVLVNESHDLIQKAVGWSLREIGKIDDSVLLSFLDKHASYMPRTMLRYSLEKLPSDKKYLYMNAKNKTLYN